LLNHNYQNLNTEKATYIYFYTFIGCILSLFTFFSYWYFVFKYSVNSPFWDDYDSVLNFLNQFLTNKDFFYRINRLFSQHNEHRIFFSRVIELLYYYVFGKIDFIHLIIVGDMGLILITLTVCIHFAKKHVKLFNLTILPIVMFSFSQYELMTWAMASLQQYYQLFFALIAILFFTKSNNARDFILGLFFSTLASFTGGGGLIIFPVILFYYIILKDLKKTLIISIYGIFIFYIYFVLLHYQSTPIGIASRIYALSHPLAYIKYILIFIGNLAPGFYSSHLYLPIFSGVILLIFAIHIVIQYLSNKMESFLFFSMLFIFATAAAAGVSRISIGVGEAASSRYGIYSLVFLVIIYGYYLIRYKENRHVLLCLNILGLIISTIIFFVWFNKGVKQLKYRSFISYHYVVYPDPNRGLKIISESKRLHIFIPYHVIIATSNSGNLPNKPLAISIKQIVSLPKNDYHADFCVDYINDYKLPCAKRNITITLQSDIININGWAVDEETHSIVSAVFADINGKLFPLTYGIERADVAIAFKNPDYIYSGFQDSINVPDLKQGKNTLSFIIVNNKETGFYQTQPLKLYFTKSNGGSP